MMFEINIKQYNKNNTNNYTIDLPMEENILNEELEKIFIKNTNIKYIDVKYYKVTYKSFIDIDINNTWDIKGDIQLDILELNQIAKKLTFLSQNDINKICAILYLYYETEIKYALENIDNYILDENIRDKEDYGEDFFKAFYLYKFADNKEVLQVLEDLKVHINYKSLGEENLINCSDSIRLTKWGLLQKV